MKPFFAEAMNQAYSDALRIATQETGLSADVFPPHCPYRQDELLDEDFWPAT